MRSHNRPISAAGTLIAVLVLASCMGSRHFHFVNPSETNAPINYLQLHSEISAATLHFPAGLYTLSATDSRGYYYRAPRKIIQHTASGLVLREGGMYVRKGNQRKMRGYVFIAGALTHVGRFSAQERPYR